VAVEGLEGVGVRNFTSSFESTACRSKGTRPAPRNSALAFWAVLDSYWVERYKGDEGHRELIEL
jgi:hypothetical protein